MDIIYPEFLRRVLAVLDGGGFESYIVGGSLRDIILGGTPNDWDVTTSALPDEVCEIFRANGYSVIPTGIKHGTVTVLSDGEPVEVTTFRVDGEYKDSRHPENVTFAGNIGDDLSRRDFTVNAIAYSPKSGLVDLYGGEEDIKNRIIRCVGEPEKRFAEDALRILRALRFMSKLDFEIDGQTLRGAEKMREGLKNVSRERIYSEISGLLLGRSAGEAMHLMLNCDILPVIFEDYGKYLPTAEEINDLPLSLPVRLAAIFIKAPVHMSRRWIASLKMSNDMRSDVEKLLETRNVRPEISPYGARRFLVRYGKLHGGALALLRLTEFDVSNFEKLLGEATNEPFPRGIKELAIGGADLISAGIKPGEAIGDTLDELFDMTLREPSLNNKEKLLKMAKTIALN